MTRARIVAGLILGALVSACASVPRSTGPAYADLPSPEIPARLAITPAQKDIHARAWQQLPSGDLGGARASYADLLKGQPSFYPAETGLGLVALAQR